MSALQARTIFVGKGTNLCLMVPDIVYDIYLIPPSHELILYPAYVSEGPFVSVEGCAVVVR